MTLPKDKAAAFNRVKEAVREELTRDPLMLHETLAAKYKIARSTISKYARQMGFDAAERQKHCKREPIFREIQAWLDADPTRTFEMASRHFKQSPTSIAHWMRKFTGKTRRRIPTPLEQARWAQMFERGTTLRRIAQITGFNAATVGKYLRERGIDTGSGHTPLVRQALQLMADEGISASDAALRVGTTRNHIHTYTYKRRKKDKQDANSNQPVDGGDHDDLSGRRAVEADGGRQAGHADVEQPRDLCSDEGGQDRSRLEEDYGVEGQASRQRLRRCG